MTRSTIGLSGKSRALGLDAFKITGKEEVKRRMIIRYNDSLSDLKFLTPIWSCYLKKDKHYYQKYIFSKISSSF